MRPSSRSREPPAGSFSPSSLVPAASVSFLIGPRGVPRPTTGNPGRSYPRWRHRLSWWSRPLECAPAVIELARRAVEVVPGLQGYVGVDLVLGEHPQVIEINPRLTTSYVGLRRFVRNNLMRVMLDLLDGADAPRLDCQPFAIEFRPDGAVREDRS